MSIPHEPIATGEPTIPEMFNEDRRTFVQHDLTIRVQHEMRSIMNDLAQTTTYNGLREIADRLEAFGREFRERADQWERVQ